MADVCNCRKCLKARDPMAVMSRMVVCADCGNKRCPRAADHVFACTQSNAAGQVGSSYA